MNMNLRRACEERGLEVHANMTDDQMREYIYCQDAFDEHDVWAKRDDLELGGGALSIDWAVSEVEAFLALLKKIQKAKPASGLLPRWWEGIYEREWRGSGYGPDKWLKPIWGPYEDAGNVELSARP